ncbi:MAG: hypothetical protein WB711_00045 [Terriglobales bacterium]
MKGLLGFALVSVLLPITALAQNQAQPNGGAQNTALHFSPGTVIRVELAKTIDAKKAKVGDEVIAKTMDDFLSDKHEMLASKGSQVLGRVVEVSPHEGKSASTLGIAFDKMLLKNETDVPFKASIQAIGAPESNSVAFNEPMGGSNGAGGMPSMESPGRGVYGGNTPNPGGATPGNASPIGTVPNTTSGTAANGRLTPNAQGVVGISGLSLSTGAAQDSLLTSPKHNVKLDSGTQMILRVIP